MLRHVVKDPLTGETFLRVIGRRAPRPIGAPPSAEDRDALATMLRYRTRAPKGVFVYRSHEEMDADRLRWTVDAMVERTRRA
jgi:hypothetical protein